MAQPAACDHCGQPDPRFWLTDTENGATLALCPAGLFEYTEAVARQYAELAGPTQEVASGPQDAPGPDDPPEDDEDRAWEASGRRESPKGRKSDASPAEGNGSTAAETPAPAHDRG